MHELELEALAREELTPAELRVLLERIGQAELGGSDAPTVAAVAEATGLGTADVGSMLAALRGEDFRRRFEHVLSNHEGRLRRLEQGKHPMANAEIKDYSHDAENFKLKPEEKESTKGFNVILGIIIAVGFLILIVLIELGTRAPLR